MYILSFWLNVRVFTPSVFQVHKAIVCALNVTIICILKKLSRKIALPNRHLFIDKKKSITIWQAYIIMEVSGCLYNGYSDKDIS